MEHREKQGLPREVLADIAAMYGRKIAQFGPVEGGYRNLSHSFTTADGEVLNCIVYKREPGIVALIRRTNALGVTVSAGGLPVRAPVDWRIVKVGSRYVSLYAYLPGETIPWEAYTMKHIKALGYAMAKFHDAAAGYDGPALPEVETVYEELYGRMRRYFDDEHVAAALREKLGMRVVLSDIRPMLSAARRLPGRTALHMDMVRSNVLFRDAVEANGTPALVVGSVELSGVLDLEKAATGHPLFDAARTLAFLLVDCPKPEEKIRKYFLDSGYRKRGGRELRAVTVAGGDILEQLISMFLTYDLYKFLKQNPYESLVENHHFMRTVAILRVQKVVQ